MQTGVVDGAENNPPSFYFDNHYQAAKYYTLTEHLIVPEILVFSRPSWDKLSKDDQALITKLAREAQADERQLWKKKEAEAIDKMKAAGIEIIAIPDKTPFQQAVKPLWDKYGAQYAALIKQHPSGELSRSGRLRCQRIDWLAAAFAIPAKAGIHSRDGNRPAPV